MYRLLFHVMPAMAYRPISRPEIILASALQRATLNWYEPHYIYFIKKPLAYRRTHIGHTECILHPTL